MKRMTDQQEAYILAHLNDRPRIRVAEAAGVSANTVYRLVKRYGGIVDHSLSTADERREEIVKAEYPHKSAREIAIEYGFSKSTVVRIVHKYNLKHTQEAARRIEEKVNKALTGPCPPDSYAIGKEKRRRKRKMDTFRVLSGMPQQTGYRIRILPVRTQKAIWFLCKRYGYSKSSHNSVVMLYDEATRRAKNERIYTERYGIEFRPNIKTLKYQQLI